VGGLELGVIVDGCGPELGVIVDGCGPELGVIVDGCGPVLGVIGAIVEESVVDGCGPALGVIGEGIDGGFCGGAGGTEDMSVDCGTDGWGAPALESVVVGGGALTSGAGGVICSGTLGVGLDGFKSVEGPSITDFLDNKPTAMSDLSSEFSIGPCERVSGMDPYPDVWG